MNMQPTTHITVMDYECDALGAMRPEHLLSRLILAQMFRNRVEGAGKASLRTNLGAAWMLRRLRFEQHIPIKYGDELQGFASGRNKLNISYAEHSEFYLGTQLAASCDMLIMPVDLAARKKLPLENIEPLFSTKPDNEPNGFDRLPMIQGLKYDKRWLVTPEQCDDNADHFASSNYILPICFATEYESGAMFRLVQIDYIRECLAGDTIKLAVKPKGEGFIVQGKHMNLFPCFNAYCEYR